MTSGIDRPPPVTSGAATVDLRGLGPNHTLVMVNGRRISGFQEIRGIPPEAIERTEILPEETALSYGYSADQRVVNFVLKANFRSLTGELSGRMPTQGGRTTTRLTTLQPASNLAASLFQLRDPTRRPGRN